MPAYLERYRNGEHEQVWRELVALGPAVREEPLYSEAQAVAREMMARARQNVELIEQRLRQIDYRFEVEHKRPTQLDPQQIIQSTIKQANMQAQEHSDLPASFSKMLEQMGTIMGKHFAAMRDELQPMFDQLHQQTPQPEPSRGGLQPSDEKLREAIVTLDRVHGPVPITLRAWFEIIGQVDLLGDHPKLSRYNADGPAADPLCIWYNWFMAEEQDDTFEDEGTPDDERNYYFEVAPDACHKSNYSGGGATSFKLPVLGFDGTFTSDDWEETYFIPYLRTCFQWGGFPGLRHDPVAAEAARDELAFLTKDLLPI